MTAKETMASKKSRVRWTIFGVIALIYFFAYFHRVSTSVIATSLLSDFETHATALGLMSSMYFYIYALEQPLVGWLSDRIGPKKVVGFWTLAASGGSLLFAIAPTISWAAAGRALIGFGVGGVYVPALKAFSTWFEKKEFAVMTGWLLAVGNFGAVVATTPLAWATETWGWRYSFFVIGAISIFLAMVAFVFVKDHKSPGTIPNTDNGFSKTSSSSEARTPLVRVFSSFRFWIMGIAFFGIYGTFLSFQGLWAAPYLETIYNVDAIAASNLNMIIPIGFIFGSPLGGWLSGHFFKERINGLSLMLILLTLSWILVVAGPDYFGISWIAFGMFLMGASVGGFITLSWGFIREYTPDSIMGLTSGLLNPAPFFGVAVFQGLTGSVLDYVSGNTGSYSQKAYASTFLICLGTTVLCLIMLLVFRKKLSTESP
jgi:MFS family permease